MTNYKDQLYLQHYGVPGMRWGVHRRTKALLGAVAIRKVGGAYANSMAKKQIRIQKEADQKISGIQKDAARRIKEAKGGEDFIKLATAKYSSAMTNKAKNINSILAQKSSKQIEKTKAAFEKDIQSFEPFKTTGIKTKTGKVIFTPKQVVEMQNALIQTRDTKVAKIRKSYGQ